ncbi:hypothetical protein ACFLRW_04250 [Acidobacteriota bacterium]
MRKRILGFFVIFLSILSLPLLLAELGRSEDQDRQIKVKISEMGPDSIKLIRGGPEEAIFIKGKNFHLITSVIVIAKVPEPGFSVIVDSVGPEEMRIKLKAAPQVPIRRKYGLRFLDSSGNKLLDKRCISVILPPPELQKSVDLVLFDSKIHLPKMSHSGVPQYHYAQVKLKNSGEEPAIFSSDSLVVELHVSGGMFNESLKYMPGQETIIFAQEVKTFSWKLDFPIKHETYTLSWTANPDDSIPEKNKTNNKISSQFVYTMHDLVVTETAVSPTHGDGSRFYNFYITYVNQGDIQDQDRSWYFITENNTLDVKIDGLTLEVEISFLPLDLGDYTGRWRNNPKGGIRLTLQNKIPLDPGTHQLTATIDPHNNWIESNEDNNTKIIQFTVK